ncbi:restriction endonuclease [Sideroxydans sp.]
MSEKDKQKARKEDWLLLEELVASIQRQLAPAAIVEHNVHIRGRITDVDRQVDVLVTQMIGQYKMTIALDCKDTKRPIDTKGVEEFAGLVADIGANKGVLVCPSGFTKAALRTAKHHQIELYRPVDTGDHKWKIRASIPALCDFRSASLAFGFKFSAPLPFTLKVHPANLSVFNSAGEKLGTPLEKATSLWNSGEFPTEPGIFTECSLFGKQETLVDNGYGTLAPIHFFVDLHVRQTLHFGQLALNKISGFLDAHTGLVVTNSFTTGLLSPEDVERNWRKLEPGESPPVVPVLKLMGLDCWPEQ